MYFILIHIIEIVNSIMQLKAPDEEPWEVQKLSHTFQSIDAVITFHVCQKTKE